VFINSYQVVPTGGTSRTTWRCWRLIDHSLTLIFDTYNYSLSLVIFLSFLYLLLSLREFIVKSLLEKNPCAEFPPDHLGYVTN